MYEVETEKVITSPLNHEKTSSLKKKEVVRKVLDSPLLFTISSLLKSLSVVRS